MSEERGQYICPDCGEFHKPEVYKVIGAPGTGKTTRVVGNPELPDVTSLVMENLKNVPFEDQMIVTYTKAGVQEAADRLERILDIPRYRIDKRVTTIHSQGYKAAGIEQHQVVQWWHKQDFCERNFLQFGFDDDNDDLMAGNSADQNEGNALFDIYGWLKSNRKPLEDYKDCPAEYPGTEDPLELMKKWEEYKANPPSKQSWKNNPDVLYDFSDMIEITVERGKKMLHNHGFPNIFKSNPESARETFKQVRHMDRFEPEKFRGKGPFVDTQILYVDEVQDLTPLQWAWYLMQKLVCEKVYIGGDDDQTIYGWAGANPDFMLDEEGEFEVLNKTYRIPREIWKVCDGVIKQVDRRQEKEVEPHGEGGTVVTMRAPSARQIIQHLEEREAMVLFRARFMIDEFREHLHAQGIPYRNMSTYDTWSDDVTTLRDALAKIDNGADQITSEEMDTLIEYAVRKCSSCRGDGCGNCNYEGEEKMLTDNNGYDARESALSSLGGVSMERVMNTIDLSHPRRHDGFSSSRFLSQSEELNYYEKEAIRGNLANNNEHMDPDRVRIGTIHSSKGKEAPVIILATDSTERILENMLMDTKDKPDKVINDAERRLYYVGMTRASEKLVLAQGLIDPQKCINLADLLEDYEPPEDQWAVQDTQTGIEPSVTHDLNDYR